MENYHEEGLVFFTDLTNFGRVTKGMELEEVANLLTTFAEMTHRTVTSGGGHVVDYISDSALGYFPADSVDHGVRALMEMKRQVEEWLETDGHKMKLRIGAHYGPFMVLYLPPFTIPDLLGETVNIAVKLGAGGQASHQGRLILTATAFRKLAPDTRKSFHKYTEPIVYIAEE
jgi:class 3 adenylate cyclase